MYYFFIVRRPTIVFEYLLQVGKATVMHIWSSDSHVAKTGYFESTLINMTFCQMFEPIALLPGRIAKLTPAIEFINFCCLQPNIATKIERSICCRSGRDVVKFVIAK